jgi:hypothetical protein
MIEQKLRAHNQNKARKVFQAWQKNYRIWKEAKDKEDFKKAVKFEI